MFALLHFYQGAISMTDYQAMSWTEREMSRQYMRAFNEAQSKAVRSDGPGDDFQR